MLSILVGFTKTVVFVRGYARAVKEQKMTSLIGRYEKYAINSVIYNK